MREPQALSAAIMQNEVVRDQYLPTSPTDAWGGRPRPACRGDSAPGSGTPGWPEGNQGHHSTHRGCGGGWGKETGAVLRYFCKDNIAEVSAGFRQTLSRRSAGTFVFNGGGLPPPSPISFPSYQRGRGARRGSAEPGEWRARGAALAQPPAAEQWGTGGGKGLAWWYFSFPPPFFFLPSLFSFYPRHEKQKPHGIKATMKGSRDAE